MQDIIPFVQQNLIMSLIWVGVFIALIANIVKTRTAQYKEVDTAEVTQLINREQGIVVDIRSADEFKSGHITDAVHILPSDIKANNFGKLESQKSNPMIVVCKTGQTAVDIANHMAGAGFENVHVLKNGIASWSEANLPLIRSKKKK
ncbi:hypothetical protein ST37_08525 [Vibrio sp. qd031]|uniref:rhodanese-like domain-containing protein n=1 Tax=Vibrio sp. qd031 TaxID=1603038 RepID=UPI000A0FBF3B|nr:rhodanese-like domain-containing protein [Vibrio sp. qd031]ORT50746.1 hypothetical protein ST37_08525 [Vibrio sp. qd031]